MDYSKELETKYNGITFKNRLKARWAAYFDNVGIEYLYEPEGYLLSNGISYLPDFYLPDYVCFAEVKAGYMNGGEMMKAVKLLEDTKFPLLCLKGVPSLKHYELMVPHEEGGEDQYRVVDVNPVQDPKRKRGKFLTGKYLVGERQYRENDLIDAIKAVKMASNL